MRSCNTAISPNGSTTSPRTRTQKAEKTIGPLFADANALTLPHERQIDGETAWRGGSVTRELTGATLDQIERIADRHETSAAVVLHASWNALLRRLTGEETLVTGRVFDFRKHEDFAEGMGLFARTVPVRCRIGKGCTFSEAVERTAATTREAYEWQEYLEPDLPGPAGIEIEVADWPDSIRRGAVTVSLIKTQWWAEPYKIKLMVWRHAASLRLEWRYDSRRFQENEIRGLAQHFQILLEGVLAEPERSISQMSILPNSESSLLRGFNQTNRPYPSETRLHNLFEASAKAHPQKTAIAFKDQNLDYGDLDKQANQMAQFLVRQGVGPDVIVGLCLERSPNMAATLLGILKAGGAYLPLDPAYPEERLAYMLSDSDAALLITQQNYRHLFPNNKTRTFTIEEIDLATAPDQPPETRTSAENLAYVIYTSGSTGLPKGVMIHHRGVVNYLNWCCGFYGAAKGVGAPVHSPIGFDLTVTSFYSPLATGGTVALVEEEEGVENLHELLRSQDNFSLLKITPAHLSVLGQWMSPEHAAGKIHTLIIGGEVLQGERLAFWREHAPTTRVINEYGPTEAVVGCCIHEIKGDPGSGPVPIGTPIDNMEMYILDEGMNLAPLGAPGEIFIGGVGLARGYLNRPGLTAERFLPHPFSDDPGRRLYRAGDLARYLAPGSGYPAGTILFLGRNDSQVKIHGYRVELGEVETFLAGHPSLRDVAVTAPSSTSGGQRLVAYVTLAPAANITVNDLREYMAQHVPDYMVPSLFVRLDALPMTVNGKVDRDALPAPDKSRPMMREAYEAPRDDLEKQIAEVWQAALDIEEIGVHDGFFALGGDSIRTVRVAALAKEKGILFSVQQLFELQTIARLADHIRTNAGSADSHELEAAMASESKITPPFGLISEEDRAKLPDDVEDAYPLGAVQLGMLFEMQIDPETPSAPAYHNVNGYRFRFPFDAELLQKAVDRVVAKHPNLRTSFHMTDYSEPMQLVHKQAKLTVRIEDLRHQSRERQLERIHDFRVKENVALFDVTKAPLLRFHLFRVSDDVVYFVLAEPHSSQDGWSTHMTMGEVFANYMAMMKNQPLPDGEPLKVGYREFIRLEREALTNGAAERFWRDQTAGRSATLIPRWPRSRFTQVDMTEHKLYFRLPEKVMESLAQLSQRTGYPIKAVLLAAHLKTISLVTGQKNLMTGLVVNGRPEVLDGDKIFGLFLNTVPMPFDFEPCSWETLVRKAHETEVRIFPHRRYPLAAMQRNRGGGPLFEIGYTYLHFHSVKDTLQSGDVQDMGFKGGDLSRTQFPLMVSFIAAPSTPNQVTLLLEYDVKQFAKDQIIELHGYYERVLQAMAADPSQRHDLSQFLSPAEERRLLGPVATPETAQGPAPCLQSLFEKRAAATPNAPALAVDDVVWSYERLNREANQWAHFLLQKGVAPEQPVAILADRVAETVMAVLAILKAGAAYAPLDPNDPADRRRYVLEDTGTRLLLAPPGADLAELASSLPENPPELLSLTPETVADQPRTNPRLRVSADHLAYIIYTSGSTGKPKGSLNSHANVTRLFQNTDRLFGFGKNDVWTLFHAFTFDFSVWELWGPLLYGAKLVLVPYWVSRSPEAFYALLDREKVTILSQTPSAFRQLMRHEESLAGPGLSSLREIVFGGEALDLAALKPWFKRHGHTRPRLVNMYGITETTVHVTYRPIIEADLTEPGAAPIGPAMPGLKCYITDSWLRALPIGAPGEILVAGSGLCRGYLHRPALTAERFTPNPFSDVAGARLYRSGDLARINPAGDLEYLGRIDHQVKIRGFRIELGEIESVLNDHERVLETAVLARKDLPGESSLVAYVVANDGKDLSAALLREYLSDRLPAHMTPAYFVFLEALPLTPNGKVNRQALPKPEIEQLRPENEYAAPRTETEKILAGIWSRLLGVKRVGIHDNFFELGGDSILCIQIVSHANQAGVSLTPQLVFRYQTIEKLAEVAQQASTTSNEQDLVTGPVPLTPIQHRFFEMELANVDHFNQAVMLEINARVEPETVKRIVALLLRHHDALRLRYSRLEEGWRQENAGLSDETGFVAVDLSHVTDEALSKTIENEAARFQADLNIQEGRLARFVLFQTGENRNDRFLMIIHHLAIDGVSWRVLIEDFQTAYNAAAHGETAALPPKTTSYRAYANDLADQVHSSLNCARKENVSVVGVWLA